MLTEQQIQESMKKCNQNAGDVKLIELTDTIDFNCKQCGKCCMNRNDIILNPFDVYNLAKEKNIEPKDVILNYCSVHLGTNSKMPIIMLDSDDRDMCPMLEFSLAKGVFECSVNNAKPGACILHPIGIVRSFNIETKEKEVQFISVDACSIHGTDKTVMVKDFIKNYLDNQEAHEAGNWLMNEVREHVNIDKLFNAIIEADSKYIKENCPEEEQEFINRIPSKIKSMLQQVYTVTILESLFSTDTSIDFLEQLDTIKKNIEEACSKIILVLAGMNIDIATKEYMDKNKQFIDDEVSKLMKDFNSFMTKIKGE